MAYKKGDRKQISFLPSSIEEYVSKNDPVRFYDDFVDSINLNEIGIKYNENQVGNSAYDPKIMLKLLVYGYSYGHKSSRELERAVHHNLSFIWLSGGLKPDHKTISEFRRKNKKALQKILFQTVKLCMKFDLIDGNVLFLDGSKFRANAGIKATKNKKALEKSLEKINVRIKNLLDECDKTDQAESSQKDYLNITNKLLENTSRKHEIENFIKSLDAAGKTEHNTTDPDAKIMHSQEGSHVCYNVQNVVDEKHGLIVNTDVVDDKNDTQQFANQIDKANEILGKKCKIACGDAGFANTKELKKIDDQGIKVIVPSKRQAKRVPDKPFNNHEFTYIEEKDVYICPVGEILKYKYFKDKKKQKIYVLSTTKICKSCQHYGVCTKNKYGRQIYRIEDAETMKKLEQQYLEPESQKIYKLRKEKVELPFGAIKHNLKSRYFLLRGFDGVKAEANLFSSCYNLKRLMNLIGTNRLIEAMQLSVVNFVSFLSIKSTKYHLILIKYLNLNDFIFSY